MSFKLFADPITSLDKWSYGAELELADLDRTKELPEGFGWDHKDFSMVNSNGIAVDPQGKLYDRGGEVLLRPEMTVDALVENFKHICYNLFPEARVNYRSNLHVHVRIPGLKDNLEALKDLQQFIHGPFREVVGILEPIPQPERPWSDPEDRYHGALKRAKRRKVSHQTFLTDKRIQAQLEATTIKQFMEREVPRSRLNKPMWHAQARCCVNIRQLLQTDTIEFRHFPGTISYLHFNAAVVWCQQFLLLWLNGGGIIELRDMAELFAPQIPKFEPYNHDLELRYLRTTCDGTVKRADREAAIKKILAEEQDKRQR